MFIAHELRVDIEGEHRGSDLLHQSTSMSTHYM